MTAKELVGSYLEKVKTKGEWEKFIADDMRFESPSPTTVGREAYVTAASRFFQMVEGLELRQLIAENDSVCAWVDYVLLKNGKRFTCSVAEWFVVRNGRIVSSTIQFDTLALKDFTTQN